MRSPKKANPETMQNGSPGGKRFPAPLNLASALRLFRRFIIRAMVREKVRTLVSVLGIALGVAVILAIRMANRSVTESFRAAVESVSGQTSLSITGVTGRFDELQLAEATWLRDYGVVSPVVETDAMIAEPPLTPADYAARRGELIHVLGVDVLVDLPIRQYRLVKTSQEDRDPTPREILLLLTDPDAVILTERLARRYGKRVGDRLELSFGSARKTLTVRGLLVDEGPAGALGGNFALMDIAARNGRATASGCWTGSTSSSRPESIPRRPRPRSARGFRPD